ncbi:MAG: hypothetical protein QW279_07345, partial [Candidatus Jordarchaeaceae archaeon]
MADDDLIEMFQRNLLKWWNQNKRDFDWRKTNNPYEILMAEILLRKTTAEQVSKIYKAFLKICPNPQALLEVPYTEIEK